MSLPGLGNGFDSIRAGDSKTVSHIFACADNGHHLAGIKIHCECKSQHLDGGKLRTRLSLTLKWTPIENQPRNPLRNPARNPAKKPAKKFTIRAEKVVSQQPTSWRLRKSKIILGQAAEKSMSPAPKALRLSDLAEKIQDLAKNSCGKWRVLLSAPPEKQCTERKYEKQLITENEKIRVSRIPWYILTDTKDNDFRSEKLNPRQFDLDLKHSCPSVKYRQQVSL